ncbi:MAG: hypothetical protein HC912_05490 [Saprospiraceae bacterium]|nr:hypothetical protein [Saprospiraceae bacterium]
MYSANFKYEQSLWKKKLLLNSRVRFNAFQGASKANLMLADIGANFVFKSMRFTLNLNNIFNGRSFIVQQITPLLYQEETRSIFQRYIRLGVQFDLN